MQVLDEQSKTYFYFMNSLDSEITRKSYEFRIKKFLNHDNTNLESFLTLSQQEISNCIADYLVERKIL